MQQRYLTINPISATEPITQALVDAAISGMLQWVGDQFADLCGPIATKRLFTGDREHWYYRHQV
ncbi:MAG: hypothetical protein R2932_50415 [Caldilineaceae bacterium]